MYYTIVAACFYIRTVLRSILMKKFILFIILACFAAGLIFSQNYTVQSVTGNITRGGGNNRVKINVGDVLTANTFIRVGLDEASPGMLILINDDNLTLTIRSVYSGKIADSQAVSRARRGIIRADTDAVRKTADAQQTAASCGVDILPEEREY